MLIFTAYNYVIYTFSIPFGPLFLLGVAVLGMCMYAVIGGIVAIDHRAVAARFTSPRAVKVAAWVLIVTAILFGLLWLSEDVPALLSGTRPQSVIDMALPTNPVHILDLAFFLPAVIITGVLLLKRKPIAYTVAPSFIVFLILTGVPILLTPVVQVARGEAVAWGNLTSLPATTSTWAAPMGQGACGLGWGDIGAAPARCTGISTICAPCPKCMPSSTR